MFKRAKIIFLGDTAVGKSCIICALNNHPINTLHEPTIGMDFSIKILNGENGEYKVQLWDTAGQEKFKSIMPSYIRNARIAVIVYDVTNMRSFLNLEKWKSLYEENSQKGASKLIVIGNKIDIYNDRRVSMQKVQKTIVKEKIIYHEISAKTGEGINDLIEILTHQLDKMDIQFTYSSTNRNITVKKQVQEKNRCCGGTQKTEREEKNSFANTFLRFSIDEKIEQNQENVHDIKFEVKNGRKSDTIKQQLDENSNP